MTRHMTDTFLIGSFVSFYPFSIDSCEYQLDQMAASGLNFNMFPYAFGGGTADTDWDKAEKMYAARNMYYFMAGGRRRPDAGVHTSANRHPGAGLSAKRSVHRPLPSGRGKALPMECQNMKAAPAKKAGAVFSLSNRDALKRRRGECLGEGYPSCPKKAGHLAKA